MNILDLPLKAIWYNMIESGKKKEEYREHNSYWAKDFMLATIKTRIAKSIFQKSASIVANHPLNIMMLSVFVTDIQNEPCYLN